MPSHLHRLLQLDKISLFYKSVLLPLVLILSSCNSLSSSNQSLEQSQGYHHVLSISIDSTDLKSEIALRYGGDILVWRPEAKLAVLGFNGVTLNTLAQSAELNKDIFQAPESSSLGNVWANKYKAWAGGWDAWTNLEQNPTTLDENLSKWQQIQLSEAQKLAPSLGKGIKVAILDTGIDLNHPAFADHLAPPAEWFDFIDRDQVPQEELPKTDGASAYGHGTGVAGIVLQIAPNATLLPLRVLSPDGSGDMTNVVMAIDWAISHGAQVINLSLGSSDEFKTLKEILKYAKKQDLILVASAGNSGEERLEYPARDSAETISVGSVNDYDVKSAFSAYGKELEIMAPGEFIYTTAPSSGIVPWSGTSFAAPIVTGAIALALGEQGTYPNFKVKDIEKKLSETSQDISKMVENKPFGKELGNGRLDIYTFLQKTFK